MRAVRQMLEAKSPMIFFVGPDAPVIDAIRLMAEKRIGALLVMEGDHLVGIVSERDYARKVILQGRSSSNTPVRDIMSAEVITVDPAVTAERCMETMTEHRVRHLPVVENERVIGVLSIGDLVKAVIEDQQLQLEQMQQYISS